MALVVETGSGAADADAFTTLAYADTYHAARGNSAWTGADTLKEQAIRRATTVLSTSFAWKGTRVYGRDQSLAWPRYEVYDSEGWDVPSDEVPQEVIDATCELALRELVSPGSLLPDVTPSELVKSEKVGPIATEYLVSSLDATASRPVIMLVSGLLGGLLASSGSGLGGTSYRI